MKALSPCSWAVAALVLAGAACSGHAPADDVSPVGLSYKISTYAYAEYGDDVTVIVGTRAARHRADALYMPVEIAVAYRGSGGIRITRESFTLLDEQRNRYAVVLSSELLTNYDFLEMDRSALAELPTVARTSFGAYRYYPDKFTPTRSRSARVPTDLTSNTIELPYFFYFTDFIYFPRSPTGVKGHRFTMLFESADLTEPMSVDFLVN
ncbi:MAG: hypothetical protein ACE5HT_01745 [Gemmatimonadales bacterium]